MEPKTDGHWERFYSSSEAVRLKLPSQFCVFMIGEIPTESDVIDVGCGTGRDALFFASHGMRAVGVDASSAAIEHCTNTAGHLGLGARFLRSDIESPDLAERLRAELPQESGRALVVYARFFLHAIPESGEDALLRLVRAVARPQQTQLAVEFRTHRDATLPKSTAHHFRRFIDPVQFLRKAAAHGMTASYFVEGFGFAKYGADDAHVARCLFTL